MGPTKDKAGMLCMKLPCSVTLNNINIEHITTPCRCTAGVDMSELDAADVTGIFR
jgi:hypothetical protein